MATRLGTAALAVRCVWAALACAGTAWAEEVQRVEITGSLLKRTDAETALPVQVLTRQQIQASGAANVEQLLQSVSALTSSGATLNASAAGLISGGLSGISLRGFTSIRTLVLINGRRAAPYGATFDSVSVDVNSIPLEAIERIEVLKDGASAVYGSDAIAGVVNFILRKDYSGIELGADYGEATRGGGHVKRATVTWGAGDMARDGFNMMVTASLQKEGALFGRDRDFASRGYNVDANNAVTSFDTSPANFFLLDSSGAFGNPAAPACQGPYVTTTPFFAGSGLCEYDPASQVALLPGAERGSVLASGRLGISNQLELFAEASYHRNRQNIVIHPVRVRVVLDPTAPFYPTAAVQALVGAGNPLPSIGAAYRSELSGLRDSTSVAEAPRLVLGVRGGARGWDYEATLLHSESRVRQTLNDGHPRLAQLEPLLSTGPIDLFGPNTPEAAAQVRALNFTGEAFRVRSKLNGVAAKVTRDLADLPSGPLSLGVGVEHRWEHYLFAPSPDLMSGLVADYRDFQRTDRGRTADAVFGELNIPVAVGFDVNTALRVDRYQGVGSSTTPKVGLRWQPASSLLLRGAVGQGFRAPSLQDLYLPQTSSPSAPAADPIRCPVTSSPLDCNQQFDVVNGGNPSLKPERSNNTTLGIVLEPTADASLAIDAFWLRLKDTITNGVPVDTILGDLKRYGHLVQRGPASPGLPNLAGPITSIFQNNINLGQVRASGIDVDGRWQLGSSTVGRLAAQITGTYFLKFEVEDLDGTFNNFVDQANPASGGVIPRWKHHLTIDWTAGPWGVTVTQNFQKSYHDVPPTPTGAPLRRVGTYEIYDLQLRYTGVKSLTLRTGIRNLLDRNPPYSNVAVPQGNFQGGYDARYADPRGRFIYAGVSWEFR